MTKTNNDFETTVKEFVNKLTTIEGLAGLPKVATLNLARPRMISFDSCA